MKALPDNSSPLRRNLFKKLGYKLASPQALEIIERELNTLNKTTQEQHLKK